MNRAEGKFPRLSVFALAAITAFAAIPALAQEEAPPPADAPPTDSPPADSPPADSAPPSDTGGASFSDQGGGAAAAGGGGWADMSFSFSGFLRLEAAYHMNDSENPNNQRGNPFNGRSTGRLGNLPIRDQVGNLLPGGLGTITQPIADAASGIITALGGDNIGVPDRGTRNGDPADNDWNLQMMRGKFDLNATFNQSLQLFASLRTIYDFGRYEEYDPDSIGSHATGYNYQKPSYFSYNGFKGGGQLSPLEVNGKNYMADFTAFYFDLTAGPVLIRLGQQQIAWGQALFFRVFDVPDGLDLRRHLVIDDALEEYADERRAAPGLRVTWQVSNEWEADSFVQLALPSIYPLPNTPFNVIPSQFTIHETWNQDHRTDFNYGARLRANFGNWGMQFIAAYRYAPEGVFRWRKSDTDTDVPGIPGSGNAVKNTPLEVDSSGVWSAAEWFTYAGQVRLDGVEGLNTLIREFAGTQPPGGFILPGAGAASLFATQVTSVDQAARELDIFFQLAGGALVGRTNNLATAGLRGHLTHEYFREKIFGAGASYVVEAEPGSLLDQLIINFETSFIPNRHFTEKSLSKNYTVADESVSALVMEKYQRFFESFPATYLVFQAIHRTKADLFGEPLRCQGGTGRDPGSDVAGNGGDNKQCHSLSNGFTAVVLAALQPFPNYIYRTSGAVLLDVRGGLLAQAGFRWSPNGSWTLDLLYNYLDGRVYGHKNENIIEPIDFADDITVRISYQF